MLKKFISNKKIQFASNLGLVKSGSFKLDFQNTFGESLSSKKTYEELLKGQIIVIPNIFEKMSFLKPYIKYESRIRKKAEKILSQKQDEIPKKLSNLVLRSRNSIKTIAFQTAILASVASEFKDSFYIEMEPNLRMQFPERKIGKHRKKMEEIIGPGQVTPHGAHKDSWFHHPKNTFNLWIPFTEANYKNGLYILPRSQKYYPNFKDQEILEGNDTFINDQWVTNMQPGSAILFLAELLHGSIINQTDKIRSTLSMRFTLEKPDSQSKKYDYKFLKKTNDKYKFFKFNHSENFSPYKEKSIPYESICKEELQKKITKKNIEINFLDKKYIFPRKCPHRGFDLEHSVFDEKECKLICPLHHLRIDPEKIN